MVEGLGFRFRGLEFTVQGLGHPDIQTEGRGGILARQSIPAGTSLIFKAHRLCVSLNSRLESNKEEERSTSLRPGTSVRPWHPDM